MSNFCKKPDRHAPKLTCGYPLPCPYHTVVVDLNDKITENLSEIILALKKEKL